jgi:hypothetical protein
MPMGADSPRKTQLKRGSEMAPQERHGEALTRVEGKPLKVVPTELDRLDQEGRIYWPEKEGGWRASNSTLMKQRVVQFSRFGMTSCRSTVKQTSARVPNAKACHATRTLDSVLYEPRGHSSRLLYRVGDYGGSAAVEPPLDRLRHQQGRHSDHREAPSGLMRAQASAGMPQQGDLIGTSEPPSSRASSVLPPIGSTTTTCRSSITRRSNWPANTSASPARARTHFLKVPRAAAWSRSCPSTIH